MARTKKGDDRAFTQDDEDGVLSEVSSKMSENEVIISDEDDQKAVEENAQLLGESIGKSALEGIQHLSGVWTETSGNENRQTEAEDHTKGNVTLVKRVKLKKCL